MVPKKKRERVPPKIFLYLARHGESNKWEISQNLEIAYSNTHRIFKKLLKKNLIYVATKKHSARNPFIDVQYYDLTFSGFVACLLDKGSWKFIDEIANQKAEELPLLFGKWSFFKEEGIKKEVINRLTGALLHVSERWEDVICFSDWHNKKTEDFPKLEPFLNTLSNTYQELKEAHKVLTGPMFDPRAELTKTVIFGLPKWHLSSEEQKKFILKMKDDLDLNLYIKNQLGKLEREYEYYLKNIKSWKIWWDSSKGENFEPQNNL